MQCFFFISYKMSTFGRRPTGRTKWVENTNAARRHPFGRPKRKKSGPNLCPFGSPTLEYVTKRIGHVMGEMCKAYCVNKLIADK